MFMYTTIILIALVVFAVTVGIFLYARHNTSSKLLNGARARAAARARERAFADTESLADPYNTILDFSKSATATEIDDLVDGRGPLTDDQLRIIGAILRPHPDELNTGTSVVDEIWNSKYNR